MRSPSGLSPNADQDAYREGEEAVPGVTQLDRYHAMLQRFNTHVLRAAKTAFQTP